MGVNSSLREKIEMMRAYITLILQMPQIKSMGKAGVFVRIYNRETADLIIGETFGMFNGGRMEASDSTHQKARWLYLNPHSVSTTESNGVVEAGGIKGRKHIIGVSGLSHPAYNSALAILLLTCFELEPRNGTMHLMRDYAKRATCETELNEMLDFHIPQKGRFQKLLSVFTRIFTKDKPPD